MVIPPINEFEEIFLRLDRIPQQAVFDELDAVDVINVTGQSKKVYTAMQDLARKPCQYLSFKLDLNDDAPHACLKVFVGDGDDEMEEVGVQAVATLNANARRWMTVQTTQAVLSKGEGMLRRANALFDPARLPVFRFRDVAGHSTRVQGMLPRTVRELYVHGIWMDGPTVQEILGSRTIVSELFIDATVSRRVKFELGFEKQLSAETINLHNASYVTADTMRRLDCAMAAIQNHCVDADEVNRFLRMWKEGTFITRRMRIELKGHEPPTVPDGKKLDQMVRRLSTRAYDPSRRDRKFLLYEESNVRFHFLNVSDGRDITRDDGRVCTIVSRFNNLLRTTHIVFWGPNPFPFRDILIERKKRTTRAIRELAEIRNTPGGRLAISRVETKIRELTIQVRRWWTTPQGLEPFRAMGADEFRIAELKKTINRLEFDIADYVIDVNDDL